MIGNKTITRWLSTNGKTTNPLPPFPFSLSLLVYEFLHEVYLATTSAQFGFAGEIVVLMQTLRVFHNLLYFAKVLNIIDLTFNYSYFRKV